MRRLLRWAAILLVACAAGAAAAAPLPTEGTLLTFTGVLNGGFQSFDGMECCTFEYVNGAGTFTAQVDHRTTLGGGTVAVQGSSSSVAGFQFPICPPAGYYRGATAACAGCNGRIDYHCAALK
jgi:hypothetical protein